MELSSTERAAGRARTMPAFAGGTHAHDHTMHSALVSLGALGVPAHRIVVHRAGREGKPGGTVVRQGPPPGSPLLPDTLVHLYVAGSGFHQALPVGMWDSGGESAMGTRELLSVLDDPLEKLKHWFHEGAPLFRIAPDDPGACARWLTLFGIRAQDWPRPLWYRLASLAASLAELSCAQEGAAFVLRSLLDLPVSGFTFHPEEATLPSAALSRLGERASVLGVNLLMGDAVEDLAVVEIEVGPVELPVYEHYAETPGGAALLRQVLALVMPVSTRYDVRWTVLDKQRAPRLGVAAENARLGINTHMGGRLEPVRVADGQSAEAGESQAAERSGIQEFVGSAA